MAKSRYIPYGYCIKDGRIDVNINEAEIVKRIFAMYINDSSYKEIAKLLQNEEISYCDNREWNKNIVGRILNNKKYVGNNIYPCIVEKITFDKVNEKIYTKSSKKASKNIKEISDLKSLMRCDNCGKRMNYQNGNWFCSKCESKSKLKGAVVSKQIVKMINGLIEHPDLVDIPPLKPYESSMEIRSLENDIYRQLDKPDCDEGYTKSLIKKLVDAKHSVCDDGDAGRQGQRIRESIKVSSCRDKTNTELLMEIAEKIIVQKNGDFFIVLKNGQKIG